MPECTLAQTGPLITSKRSRTITLGYLDPHTLCDTTQKKKGYSSSGNGKVLIMIISRSFRVKEKLLKHANLGGNVVLLSILEQ